jgi:hypothetical protein
MSGTKATPRFLPELLTPHAFVPMRAWPGCYACLRPWWHPVHADHARLTPVEGTENDG